MLMRFNFYSITFEYPGEYSFMEGLKNFYSKKNKTLTFFNKSSTRIKIYLQKMLLKKITFE